MAGKNTKSEPASEAQAPSPTPFGSIELGEAIGNAVVRGIEAARPLKKTPFTRKANTPWTPKDGSPKLKLKRKMFQHGLEMDEARLSNEEIDALNQLRPGVYCNGHVKVIRRRDKGIDIQYPFKTKAHQLELITKFGIRSLAELVDYCIVESLKPKKAESDEI